MGVRGGGDEDSVKVKQVTSAQQELLPYTQGEEHGVTRYPTCRPSCRRRHSITALPTSERIAA